MPRAQYGYLEHILQAVVLNEMFFYLNEIWEDYVTLDEDHVPQIL